MNEMLDKLEELKKNIFSLFGANASIKVDDTEYIDSIIYFVKIKIRDHKPGFGTNEYKLDNSP